MSLFTGAPSGTCSHASGTSNSLLCEALIAAMDACSGIRSGHYRREWRLGVERSGVSGSMRWGDLRRRRAIDAIVCCAMCSKNARGSFIHELTCDGRRFDDGGRPEEGRDVAGGGDGRVQVAGLRLGGLRLVGRGAGGRRDRTPAALHGPGALVQARVEAEHVEVGGRRRGLSQQERGGVMVVVVMMVVLGWQRVQAVHDHGARRWPACHKTSN